MARNITELPELDNMTRKAFRKADQNFEDIYAGNGIAASAANVTVDPVATGIPAVVESQALFNILTYKMRPTDEETAAGVDDLITQFGRDPYDLRRYDVDFNDDPAKATSNTTILNALGAAAWVHDVTFYWPPGICRINDTVTFSNIYISHNFDNRSEIHYYGTANKIALVFGNASTSRGSKKTIGGAGLYLVSETSHAWSDEGFIGCQILGTHQNCIDTFRSVTGFTVGLQLRPSTNGIAYSTFNLGIFQDNKYHIDIHSFAANCFVNENTFNDGSFRTSAMANTDASYGVRFKAESGAYTSHNRNFFKKASFELGTASGTTDRIPVLYDNAGVRNKVTEARVETGRMQVVKINCDTVAVTDNWFDGDVLSGTYTNGYQTQTDGGTAYNNVFIDTVSARQNQLPHWDSGDLVKGAWPSTSTQISIKGIVWGIQTNSTIAYTQSGRVAKDYIIVADSARGLGVQIDTTYYKQWTLRKDVRASRGGRVVLVPLDSTGAVLIDSGGTAPYVVANSPLTATTGANTWGGQKYVTGTDGESSLHFTVGSAVESVRVFLTGGTAFLHARSFSLEPLTIFSNPKPIRIFTGLSQNPDTFYSTGVPGTNLGGGFSPRGERIMNAAAASGQPSGWVQTAEGWTAKAWVLSTAYVIGDLVTNDTGKTYVMTATSGTSAGSGGPTGTGTAITDNTCTWDYVGTQATFSAMANL